MTFAREEGQRPEDFEAIVESMTRTRLDKRGGLCNNLLISQKQQEKAEYLSKAAGFRAEKAFQAKDNCYLFELSNKSYKEVDFSEVLELYNVIKQEQ